MKEKKKDNPKKDINPVVTAALFDYSRESRNILSSEQKKILFKELLDFEKTFYLIAFPVLMEFLLGVKPMWVAGRGDGDISSKELYYLKMRFHNKKDADTIADFFSQGKSFKKWDAFFKRYDYYWEGDLRNEL